jgi:hypothetical protein
MLKNLVSTLISRLARTTHGERGLATFSLALLAVLATASTATTVTIAQGDVNFTALEDVVGDSVNRVGATLEVRGSVIARSDDGATVDRIQVPLRYLGEGKPVPLDVADPDRPVIAYYDDATYHPNAPYTYELLSSDGDNLLEPGELALFTIDLSAIPGATLQANHRLTLEISAPIGGTVIVSRRVPIGLSAVTSLY